MAAEQKPKEPGKDPAKKALQDDDVIGKAYDGRLNRRLLT
jgi:ATP-binding cassette subfamily B multidrug efflux pump